jgi:hypothetical protein
MAVNEQNVRSNNVVALLAGRSERELSFESKIKGLFSEKAIWIPPPYHGKKYVGLETISKYVCDYIEAFPDLEIDILSEINIKGQTWIMTQTSETLNGNFLGIEGNGRFINYEIDR